MRPLSRLVLLNGAAESAVDAFCDGKSLVYRVRSSDRASDRPSFPNDAGSTVPSPSSRCSGTLGQLLILLYRWLGGKKCFVYSQRDSITLLKLAQMKSGDEATRDAPTLDYWAERGRRVVLKLRDTIRHLEDRSSDEDFSETKKVAAPNFDSILEYYRSFADHSKGCDSFELLESIVDALRRSSTSEGTARSILENVVVVVDRKTLAAAATSSTFGRMVAFTLFAVAGRISSCSVESNSSSDLTEEEASSLWRSMLPSEKSKAYDGEDGAAIHIGTPARTVSMTPSRGYDATPRPASRASPKEFVASPRNLRVTPRRSQATPKNVSSSLAASFSSPASSTETHARQVILSYLRLVLNSRDELALAHCADTPKRGLDHDAFTDLRHEAETKGMPMFQCASSFVVRLRLGGKGYQEGDNSRLRSHANGLGELVDLIQRCQNVVEEGDKDAVASLQKIVNMLKCSIVKARDNRLRVTSVEKAAKSIRDSIPLRWSRLTVIGDFAAKHNSNDEEYEKKIGARGSETKKLLGFLLDEETGTNLDAEEGTFGVVLSDAYSSTATPICFPSLWSRFQTPASTEGRDDAPSPSNASPTLPRRRGNNDDCEDEMPLSPLCLNETRVKKRRTPIALKSTFTWATTDSPPCRAYYYEASNRRHGVAAPRISDDDGDDGRGSGAIIDEDNFVATQDAEGPTLVMRTRKRKLDAGDGVGELVSPAEIGGGEAVATGATKGGEESFLISAVVADKDDRVVKKSKPNKKPCSAAAAAPRVDPKKPKARRKIIPLLAGQQKLSGFFKS